MIHHGAGLRRLKQSDELIDRLKSDFHKAALSEADAAMLKYSEKLTLAPHSIGKKDIAMLKTAGFSESAILDICQIVGYFNFVNRLADGLGVRLEDYWEERDLGEPSE